MRLLKMFGLAALAAVAAMAFVGAGSASAEHTALCEENQELCSNPYTGHVEATALKPTLKTELGTVECEKSHILGKALGLAKPQVTHLELVSFTGNCHIGLQSCAISTDDLGLLDLLRLSASTGTLTSLGTNVLVLCTGVIHCVYGGEITTLALETTATHLALVHANTSVEAQSGLLCPDEAVWNALYTIQLPHELYIST